MANDAFSWNIIDNILTQYTALLQMYKNQEIDYLEQTIKDIKDKKY